MNEPTDPQKPRRGEIIQAARLAAAALLIAAGVISCALCAVAQDTATYQFHRPEGYIPAAVLAVLTTLAGAILFVREWKAS